MSNAGTFSYDNLIAGDFPLATKDVLVESGQNLTKGSVLGRVKTSTPTTGTADGGNTGDGTCTAVTGGKDTVKGTYTAECTVAITNGGTFTITGPNGYVGMVTIDAGAGGTGVFTSDEINLTITDGATDFALGDKFTIAVSDGVPTTGTADGGNTGNGTVTLVEGRSDLKVGTYIIECTAAATNSGVFKVTNPDSNDIETGITIPAGAGNSIAFDNDEIAGTITDGTTDFAVGDKFTVAITIDPRQVVLLDKTATDGSSEIYGVLADDVDASSASKRSVAYLTGQFNERQLIFASGTDVEDVRAEARDKSIFIERSVSENGLS